MRAHQIMTTQVITIVTDAPIVDAANIMLDNTSAAFRWSMPPESW
jgi:CBS domain-containing protein